MLTNIQEISACRNQPCFSECRQPSVRWLSRSRARLQSIADNQTSSTEPQSTPDIQPDTPQLGFRGLGILSLVPLVVSAGVISYYPLYHHLPAQAIFIQMTAAQTLLSAIGGLHIGSALVQRAPVHEGNNCTQTPPQDGTPFESLRRKQVAVGALHLLGSWAASFLPAEFGMFLLMTSLCASSGADYWCVRHGLFPKTLARSKALWTIAATTFLGVPFVVYL